MAFFSHLVDGPLSGPRIGVVRIEGTISDTKKTMEWIAELEEKPNVHGFLIRVDSPGGGVVASQELHDVIKRLAEDRPVVVSMGSVAASGGLMISTGATHIVANASTLTGSIGVKMEMPNVEKLMRALGLDRNILTSGDLKDAGSPFRTMTDSERNYFQAIIMELHDQFVTLIAVDRNLPLEAVQSFADGRVFTGATALELGIVDSLGGEHAALDVLVRLCRQAQPASPEAEAANDAPYTLIEQPEDTSLLRELLQSALGITPPTSMTSPQFLYE
ncbi:MAG: signal peptide peptidase SppA [Pseudomonadota bacterium]